MLLVGQTVDLHTMRRGDGFSRSMAVSFGGLCTCVLWGLIAVLLGLAKLKASFPSFSGWAALVTLPIGVAVMLRVNHLMRSDDHSRWLIVAAVMPAALLLALSVVVRFEQPRAWLESDGLIGLGYGLLMMPVLVALFAGGKPKR